MNTAQTILLILFGAALVATIAWDVFRLFRKLEEWRSE